MKNLLVTGFDPFGGEDVSPSWELARSLSGEVSPVPVSWPCSCPPCSEALHRLDEALRRVRPAMVVAIGQAGGRCDLSLERVAINVDDARIPDNAGAQPVDEPVVADGPAAYFSTLPIKAIVAGLRAAGFPASVSRTGGHLRLQSPVLRLAAPAGRPGRAQRVSCTSPTCPEQAARHPGAPSLPLPTLVAAVPGWRWNWPSPPRRSGPGRAGSTERQGAARRSSGGSR